MWRRQIYSGLAHGVKLINAYRFRDSYDSTDVMDYADADAIGDIPFAGMHLETRRTFWELGGFEDVIAAGRPAAESRVALLMCETTDIWAPSEQRSFHIGAIIHRDISKALDTIGPMLPQHSACRKTSPLTISPIPNCLTLPCFSGSLNNGIKQTY